MTITITWAQIILSVTAWYLLRYLYFAYIKWTSGEQDPFSPFVEINSYDPVRAWENGFLKGKARIIREFNLQDRCTDQNVLDYLKKTDDSGYH